MQPIIRPALRGLQILWTLIITALIGNAIATNINAAGSATAAVNFCMFVAVVAWLASLYGLLRDLFTSPGEETTVFRSLISLPLDVAAVLFTFIAAVVLSAKLGVVNCSNVSSENHSPSYIALGSANNEKKCREIQASAVFMWFLFICFSLSLFFTVRDARGSGGSVLSTRPSISRPMAQVGV